MAIRDRYCTCSKPWGGGGAEERKPSRRERARHYKQGGSAADRTPMFRRYRCVPVPYLEVGAEVLPLQRLAQPQHHEPREGRPPDRTGPVWLPAHPLAHQHGRLQRRGVLRGGLCVERAGNQASAWGTVRALSLQTPTQLAAFPGHHLSPRLLTCGSRRMLMRALSTMTGHSSGRGRS